MSKKVIPSLPTPPGATPKVELEAAPSELTETIEVQGPDFGDLLMGSVRELQTKRKAIFKDREKLWDRGPGNRDMDAYEEMTLKLRALNIRLEELAEGGPLL